VTAVLPCNINSLGLVCYRSCYRPASTCYPVSIVSIVFLQMISTACLASRDPMVSRHQKDRGGVPAPPGLLDRVQLHLSRLSRGGLTDLCV
jgi:hypothetical protein